LAPEDRNWAQFNDEKWGLAGVFNLLDFGLILVSRWIDFDFLVAAGVDLEEDELIPVRADERFEEL
jgi:hypothetical protein